MSGQEFGLSVAPTKTEAVTGTTPREKRLALVERLPAVNFTSKREELGIKRCVAMVGLPVDNITSFHKKINDKGREDFLGSWGVGRHYGEFSVYELLGRVVPEKKLGTVAHELAHANSPFEERNDSAFGGRETRESAADFAKRLASQTDRTGIFMNPYHRELHMRFREGRITFERFVEETWAIVVELALSNRAKLEQVHEAWRSKMDRLGEGDHFVGVITEEGRDVPGGVDAYLIKLIEEVNDVEGLRAHADGLKIIFYTDSALDIFMERLNKRRDKHTHQIG